MERNNEAAFACALQANPTVCSGCIRTGAMARREEEGGTDMSASESMTDKTLQIRLFGPFDVRIAGIPLPPLRSRRGAWLLALLALRHGREVQREWLAGLLWPESDPEQALGNLRRTLTDLRAALKEEAHRLQSPTSHSLSFDLSGDAFADVVLFDTLLARRDAASLEQAMDLYRGPLLEDCLEDWAVLEREARAQTYVTALERLADTAIQQNCPLDAVRYLRRIVAADPLNEASYRLLMRTLTEAGDYAAMSQCYRDLQKHLRRELNADPDPETVSLFHTLSRETRRSLQILQKSAPARYPRAGAEQPHAAAAPAEETPTNLPAPITAFIGREAEREAVLRLLTGYRLVTLLGPGGIGKTRMAIQAASEVRPDYSGGVWFVDLAPLSDPTLVIQAVAAALGVPGGANRPLMDLLVERLRRPTLLLLDNCEHLIAACASLAETLLLRCPELRLLATSRERLQVQGGAVWRVPSLSLPLLATPEEKEGVDELVSYDAIRLFVERARLVSPDFALSRRSAPLVIQICRRLDGIPLAIELAAARLQGLSVEQIAARLDDRFRLLSRGNQGALPRHQTLQAAVGWSYDLLSPAERTLLRRVTVFAGGWTLEAAEALCADPSGEILQEDIADLLAQLADKSMVIYDSAAPQGRFLLLETIRQFVAQQPFPPGEQTLPARHRDWYLAFAEAAEPELTGPEQGVWLERLEAEHDNLRAALDFCSGDPEGIQAALQLVGALGRFWDMHGYLYEGRRRTEAALRREGAEGESVLRIAALYAAGALAMRQFALPEARVWLEEGLQICRKREYPKKLSAFLDTLGLVELESDNLEAARRLFQESLELSDRVQDSMGKAASLNNLGRIAFAQGDYSAAQAFYRESLALWRENQDKRGISALLTNLGNLAYQQSRLEEARAFYEESLQLKRDLGMTADIAMVLGNLGLLVSRQGDYNTARLYQEEALQLRRKLGNPSGLAATLNNLAEAALGAGDWKRAQALLEESVELAQSIGDRTIQAIGLNNLAMAAHELNDNGAAEAFLQQALELWRTLDDPYNITPALTNLGALAVERGDLHLGSVYLIESLQIRRRLEDKVGIVFLLDIGVEIAIKQECWEQAARCMAAAEALRRQMEIRPSPTEETHFSQLRTEIQDRTSPQEFNDAWARAASLSWQEAATLVEETIPFRGSSAPGRPDPE